MQHRILNGSCVISVVLSLAILVNNLALGLDPHLNILVGFSLFFFSGIYYFSRFRKHYLFPMWALLLFCMAIIPSVWFLNSGIFGSTVYIGFVILTLIIILSRGTARFILAGLFIAIILAAIIVEYYYPGLVVPYESRAMQFADIVLNLAFSFIMMSLLVMLMVKNYEEEKSKADEANRLKSLFLANISHEIRTPMNSILGFSDLLRDGSMTEPERMRTIDIIHRSGTHLLELIDDILDLARIEAGHVIIHERAFSVDAMMRELLDIFTLQLKGKNSAVSLYLDLPEGVRAGIVIADDTRLRQVLMNLVGNAVKFTASGSIRFGYRLSGPGRLLFRVSDTGIGIRPEDLSRIFQQFKQADETLTRQYGGAGLGLSISKKLINLMGGDILVESEPGNGSTFSFDITFRAAGDGDVTVGPDRTHAAGDRERWRGRTVLVVEDDDDSFRFLERVLSRHGITVIRAMNGIEAVEACRADPGINCVLMDIQLPFMSGNEAARLIRSFRRDLPIIAQSGNAFDADRIACLEAGCNEFMAKPILKDRLLSVLERFL